QESGVKSQPTAQAGSESTAPAKQAAPATTAAPTATAPSMDISTIPEVILMPRLSDTMTEGVIAAWHKNIGDKVKKGDLLADVETDKATMELESYKDGELLYIGAQKGDKVAVNNLLCIIGDKAKVDVNSIVAASKGGATSQGTAAS